VPKSTYESRAQYFTEPAQGIYYMNAVGKNLVLYNTA